MVDNSSHQAKNHGLWKTTGVYNFFVGGGDLFFFFFPKSYNLVSFLWKAEVC